MTTTSKNGLVHIVFHKHEVNGNPKTDNNFLTFTTSTIKEKKKGNDYDNCPAGRFLKKKKKKNCDDACNSKNNLKDNFEKPQAYTRAKSLTRTQKRGFEQLTPVTSRGSGLSALPQIATRHYKLMPTPTHSSATSTSAEDGHVFLDDAEFAPASARDLESTCVKIKRSQQAAQMASRIINIKIASEKANLPMLSSRFSPFHSGAGAARIGVDFEGQQIQASPATLARVNRVKASLELHYEMIAAYQDASMSVTPLSDNQKRNCKSETEYRNEYNPLRIIRNRRTRDLLKLPDAQTQVVQLAEQQMESRLLCYAKSPWTVDAYEMVMDCSWSQQLTQLQKQGKNLLQIENTEEIKNTDDAKVHLRKTSTSLDPLEKVTTKASLFSSTQSLTDLAFRRPERKISQFQQPLKKEDRRKSKSSSMLLDLIRPTVLRAGRTNFPAQRSVSSSTVSLPTQPTTPIKAATKSGYAVNSNKALNRVSGHNPALVSSPLCSEATTLFCDKSTSAEPSTAGDSTWLSPKSCGAKPSQLSLMHKTCARQLEEYRLYEILYITQHQHNQQQLDSVGPATRGSAENARANRVYADISKTLSYAHRTLLPKAHALQQAHEAQVQLLWRTNLSKLSTRIDMLLADCDQTSNRLSTTINLELKTLTEKIDALDRHVTIKKHVNWCLCATMYCLLEYVVVSIMWVAWGLMSAFMIGKNSVLIVTKTIRWLLWC